ncbi:MAG: DNA integrity scanning protein DisA nucleotide-binding domain protein [Candidatus Natronoplasma sp.]
MTEFIETVLRAKEEMRPSNILLLTDSQDLMERLSDEIDDVPITIFTKKPSLSSFLGKSNVDLQRVRGDPAVGLDVLDQVKELVVSCVAEGMIDREDHVMLVVSADIQTILCFDMEELGVVDLRNEVEDRIGLKLLEDVFRLGTKIVREGKEGFPAGALFIIGDMNRVLNKTTESVQNPLEGQADEQNNIKNKENWNTIKEFAMLDGALVLDKFGNPVAAGRYVMFKDDSDVKVEDGLGGRHLAASYISDKTNAVALVVSTEGTIRIYKDGENIYEVDVV